MGEWLFVERSQVMLSHLFSKELIHIIVWTVVSLAAFGSGGGTFAMTNPDEPAHREFPIRGPSDVTLNCPTLCADFPKGSSLRCDSCTTVAREIARRVVDEGESLEDALDVLCQGLAGLFRLRQRTNGRRYWARREKGPKDRQHDGVTEVEEGNEFERYVDDAPLSFFTPEEVTTLPCAAHTLKQFCFRFIETLETADIGQEAFSDGESRSVFWDCVPRCRGAGRRAPAADTKEPLWQIVERQRPWRLEDAEGCLLRNLCEHPSQRALRDCDSRTIEQARKAERVLFLKYQGKFGSVKVPFEAEELSSKLYKRNPFAPGGIREHENNVAEEFDSFENG